MNDKYSHGYDEDGDPITVYPDGCYALGHCTPIILRELNSLHTQLADAEKRAEEAGSAYEIRGE